METKTHGRRVRPEDYDNLVEFYQSIITNKVASLRMRLTAAKQLDAILTRIERRGDAEDRRNGRARLEAVRAQHEASQRVLQATPEGRTAPKTEREASAERALQNLGKILAT